MECANFIHYTESRFIDLQSESDQERRGSLMKPTISSQNKANGGMTSSSSSAMRSSNSNLRRRGMQSSGETNTCLFNFNLQFN